MKTDSDQGFSPIRAALLMGVAYYIGARLGFKLTLHPIPVSTLWPPNSLLLAGLLLTPTRSWWVLLLAAFPAHLVVELQAGVPLPMVLCWFVSNCTEALLGAGCVRYFVKGPLRFDKFQDVSIFVLGAATLATLLSSFLDAGFVVLNHWGGSDYWGVVRTRFFSNSLASLTLAPVLVTWLGDGLEPLRGQPRRRYVEAGVLGAGLLVVGFAVFAGNLADPNPAPVMLYAPLPFLVWAAVRFGPRGISAALLLVSSLAIWGAVQGHGPFAGNSPAENALAVQLFLIVVSVLSLSLAAIMRERVVGERDARGNQVRLNLGLEAAQVGTWEWDIVRGVVVLSDKSSQIFGLSAIQQELSFNQFLGLVFPNDRAALSQAIQGAIEQRTPYECEFRVKRSDSITGWVLSKGKVLYDRMGRPEHMLGVNVDITERKANEELRREERTLRESEARLRELADAMPQIVWSVRPDGQFEYFNRRWYELTGVPHGEIGQDSWLPMTHPDDRDAVHQGADRGDANGGTPADRTPNQGAGHRQVSLAPGPGSTGAERGGRNRPLVRHLYRYRRAEGGGTGAARHPLRTRTASVRADGRAVNRGRGFEAGNRRPGRRREGIAQLGGTIRQSISLEPRPDVDRRPGQLPSHRSQRAVGGDVRVQPAGSHRPHHGGIGFVRAGLRTARRGTADWRSGGPLRNSSWAC